MVKNFLKGGAAINVFCRQHNIELKVVDAGVNHDWSEEELSIPNFIISKVAYGTENYLEQAAMSVAQCKAAIEKGRAIAGEVKAGGCNIIGFGEMGISNTSSASLIMSAITGCAVADCAGRGTGVDDVLLQKKKVILEQAARFHQIDTLTAEPVELLRRVGGYELAMMTGAYLEAAAQRMVIVVDGFIATAALMVALVMNKEVLSCCIFAHASGEQGHQKMLTYLGVKPLLHLGLRLGEGTGAALAIPLIQSAVNFMNEMASFESAGVSNKL
jgi:nicotinate-nucleotide--dimethylbenzimidazole phosphoribosyltransferase